MDRSIAIALMLLLLAGCAVARWQVPMRALQGQSELQQRVDAEACDAEAKARSGYDRGVEAKTWLWGIPAWTGVGIAAVTKVAVDTVTVWPVPEVDQAFKATADKILATKPKGNASWGSYFASYRTCMTERGYAESR